MLPWRWLATAHFALLALTSSLGKFSPAGIVIATAGIALFAPPLQDLAKRRWDFWLPGWGLLALFVALLAVTNIAETYQEQAAARYEVLRQKEAAEQAMLADKRHFGTNKQQVLEQIARLGEEKKFDEALALGQRYLKVVQDAELQAAAERITKDSLLSKLHGKGLMSDRDRANAYEQLSRLDPANPTYAKKAGHYDKLADAVERQLAADIAKAERQAARKARLEKQFSGWDGAHRNVETEVKRTMKNPSSYEHVETRYTDLGKGMRIVTTFRGTNSFGGVVPNTVVATVDDDGNVLTMRTL